VLLLINNEADLSLAELRLAEWVGWSPAQPGVALLNIEVPNRGYTRQIDALIWTPQRCIAVEVKGFHTRQDGELVVAPNGPWRMADGAVADIYGNDRGHNPMNQVRANTLASKNWIIDETGRGCFVHGLVLVMLLPGQNVPSLRATSIPPMTDIIIEDFDVFRYYLHKPAASEPVVWTSERVGDIIDALGLPDLYSSRRQLATALGETANYVDLSDSPF
jgi:hypothetical protein